MTIVISRLDLIVLLFSLAVIVYGAGPVLLALGWIALAAFVLVVVGAGAIAAIGFLIAFPLHPPPPWPGIILAGLFAFAALGIPYAFLSPTSEWRNRKKP